MKPTTSFALLSALATLASQGAVTAPVGYVSLGDTVGANAAPASSDTIISVPLARAAEFSGAVASSDGSSTITVAGTPAWTVDQWGPTSGPYCAIVTSGAEEGLLALISSNTADTLTVTVVTGDLANVVADDAVRIEPCWTLQDLLPSPAVAPAGTQVFAFNGTVPGINLSATEGYTSTPGGWFQTVGGSGAAGGTILYPGESFILRTGATAIAELIVTGEVPTWNHRTTITKLAAAGVAGQDSRVSYFSPVGEQLGSANIPASVGDQLLIFDNSVALQNKSASQIMTLTPGGWFGTAGPLLGDQSTYEIGGGAGYVLRQGAGVAAGDYDWSDEQSYIPSL